MQGDVVFRTIFRLKLRAAQRMLRSACEPARAQQACLRELLVYNAETTYGKRHGFAGIDSIPAFQESVPLMLYEDIRVTVDTIANGSDPHALTRDDVIAFSTSSGTTNRPKLIPITKSAIQRESRVKEGSAAFLVHDHPEILRGKWFVLFNRTDVGHTPTGLEYGSNAGYMYVTTPGIFKRRFFPVPYEVCLIDDYASRYYTILRFLLECDITYLICINPFSALLLARLVDTWKDDLLRDLRGGGLKQELALSDGQRAFFTERLSADRERAARLTAAADRRGRLEPRDYWPNLSIVSSWRTGHSTFFAERIPEWYPHATVREVGYGSSEFRTGLVVSDDGSHNIPVPDNYFYEFIPLGDEEPYRAGRKPPLLLHELEHGAKYHLIQTGIHGFYRYEVQDIVAVNGRYEQTPTIEFVQKSGSLTSVAGERLYEFQVGDAIRRLAEQEPVFFVAYADSEDRLYRIAAEFREQPDEQRFVELLDAALRDECPGYARARADGELDPPRLHVLDPGQGDAYVQWISEGALYDMQAKIHRLKPDYHDDFAYLGISRQPV